ncbi:MAG TPA: hypothetical protein DCY25_13355 [Bacteroidales bacterium]|nr:hypothetical protein [Bacteroidales bacterium]
MQKPETLATSGRSEVQEYKLHDNRYREPAGGSQLTPAESGQGHRLMYYYKEFQQNNASLLIISIIK